MATALRQSDAAADARRNDLAPLPAEWPGAAPARFIFREISMKFEGGIKFFYKDPGLAQPLPAGGIAEVVAGLVAPPPGGLANLGELTEDTPLDLNIHGPSSYVVLRLDSDLNWRFDSNEPAVSLKDAAVGNHYGGLRHVLADGTVQEDPQAGCRLVYFVAQPPALPANGSYRHGFNFHVELIQVDNNASGILPIIIDPDVGHPGGSAT